jgi:dihydrofolate reductase
MGRKTYQSIGRPLPNRLNIIITRNHLFRAPGCFIVHAVAEACIVAKEHRSKKIFVIGGAEVYAQTLPQVQRIYLTVVHHSFTGDTYFPELNNHVWQETERITHPADANHTYAYSFLYLIRRS